MMKLSVCIGAALLLGAASLSAQPAGPAPSHARSAFVSLQGGTALDIYENAFTYRENSKALKLFTFQGAASVGYDFNDTYGVRLQAAYGNDAGACNVRETSGGGFYPYSFRHVNAFADILLNLNGLAGKITAFRPKLYAGLGGAYTFGFTDAKHPWQKVTPKNIVPGFRGGFIAEYNLPSGFGFFADLGLEAYHDMYNGLMPSKEEQKSYEGYGGFPLDLRGMLTFGIIYHFQ
jgi:hypothetical protein